MVGQRLRGIPARTQLILALIAAFALFTCITLIAPLFAPCTVYLQKSHVVFDEPNLESAALTEISAQQRVRVIGQLHNGDWWQIEVNEQIGWITGDFTDVNGFCLGVPETP